MLQARVEPRTFGRYTLLTKLAAGGMATVYLAQSRGELGFERLVAIKIIHPHLLDQYEFLARFLHEGKIASQIRHPHVVSVLDVGRSDTTPYLVLDYVRGAALSELVAQARDARDPPTLAVACAIVQEALDGLEAVHAAQDDEGRGLGLIHRDISPHNLLVSADGVTYVTDLGIARARGVVLTQGTGLLGKAGYIAPEQLAKEPLTSKLDLFAMGVVLWELLTLERLFEDLEAELGMLTGTFALVPPSRHNASVPPELDRFVAQLLAREPERRPPSAGAAASELARIVPPAPRSAIAEWVQALASGRLDRLDAVVREARTMTARDTPLTWPPPLALAPNANTNDAATKSVPMTVPRSGDPPASSPSSSSARRAIAARPSSRRAVVIALVGVVVGLGGGRAVWSLLTRPASDEVPAEAASAAPTSRAAMDAAGAAPSASAASPVTSASAPPSPSAAPGSPGSRGTGVDGRKRSRPPAAFPNTSASASAKPNVPALASDGGAAPSALDPFQRL